MGFNAARVKGTGDVEVLLRGEDTLRSQIRSSLTEGGPSFQKGFDRWAAGDWDLSPSPYRSESRSKKRSKQKIRNESSQSGSSGRDRKKKKTRRETSSSSGTRRRNRRSRSSTRSRSGSNNKAKPAEPEKPQFTLQDLETLPASTLRSYCTQYAVLPIGAVERGEFVSALAPFAKPASSQPKVVPPKVQQPRTAHPNAFTPLSSAKVSPASVKSFTPQDLEAMPSKALRALCVERGVLPNGSVERSDLVQALTPLAASS